MQLKSLIASIENNPTAKTASARTNSTAPTSGGRRSEVSVALAGALAEVETVKQASERRNPTADLEKMAAEVADGHRDSEVAHAEKCGAAMGHSFIRTLASYEAAADRMAQEKTAEMAITPDELAMIQESREDPEGFVAKMASLYGEMTEEPGLTEKQAAEVWEATAQDTVRGIHKIAMDHYANGYAVALQALEG